MKNTEIITKLSQQSFVNTYDKLRSIISNNLNLFKSIPSINPENRVDKNSIAS